MYMLLMNCKKILVSSNNHNYWIQRIIGTVHNAYNACPEISRFLLQPPMFTNQYKDNLFVTKHRQNFGHQNSSWADRNLNVKEGHQR